MPNSSRSLHLGHTHIHRSYRHLVTVPLDMPDRQTRALERRIATFTYHLARHPKRILFKGLPCLLSGVGLNDEERSGGLANSVCIGATRS